MAARNAKASRAALGSQRGRDPFVKERVVGKTFGFPYMIFFLFALSFFIQKERKGQLPFLGRPRKKMREDKPSGLRRSIAAIPGRGRYFFIQKEKGNV